jgi:hypothetical protein
MKVKKCPPDTLNSPVQQDYGSHLRELAVSLTQLLWLEQFPTFRRLIPNNLIHLSKETLRHLHEKAIEVSS